MKSDLKHMFFIDGSNLLIELSKEIGVEFRSDKPPLNAINLAQLIINNICTYIDPQKVIRKYWFGSYQGSEEFGEKIKGRLRECDFEPVIIKKKNNKEKGVDISLTKEALVNAFNKNFEIAYLVSGDEDFLPVVAEIKRYGAKVYGAFFEHGLSPELKLSFDLFNQIGETGNIREQWHQIIDRIKAEIKG